MLAGLVLSGALRENPFHACVPGAAGNPWLVEASSQSLPPSSLCVWGSLGLCFLIKTLVIGLGPTLLQHNLLLTNYVYENPIFKSGHILRFQVAVNFRGRWGLLFNPIELQDAFAA